MSDLSKQTTIFVESRFSDSIFSLSIAALFSLLGLSVGGPLILVAINPPQQEENAKSTAPAISSRAALTAGLACPLGALSLSGLLVWLRLQHVERYEADELGVTWFKPFRFRGRIEWRELRRIVVNNGKDQLVLEGPIGVRPFYISHHLSNFRTFLEQLQRQLPWEALTRARPMLEELVPGIIDDVTVADPAESKGIGPSSSPTKVTLPLEQSRYGMALFPLAGAMFFGSLGAVIWYFSANPRPSVPPSEQSDLLPDVVWIIITFTVSIGLVIATFVPWYRMRIEERGIRLTYLWRTRNVVWQEVEDVRVEVTGIVKGTLDVSCFQRLVIQLTDGKQFALPLADRSAAARDAILRASRAAGVPLS